MAVLPFMVAGMIPYWIAERCGVALEPAGSVGFQGAGLALLGSGLLLVFSTVWWFATEGRGTLAPWDPMISGIILILFGEAAVLDSPWHAAWAAFFLVLNLLYIPLVEEPQLEKRFGDAYQHYRGHVRRFVLRLRPWRPGS
jgi:hypothetical protein